MKMEEELTNILLNQYLESIIYKEILYKEGTFIYWCRVEGFSPNGKFMKICRLDIEDTVSEYIELATIKIVDVLNQIKLD